MTHDPDDTTNPFVEWSEKIGRTETPFLNVIGKSGPPHWMRPECQRPIIGYTPTKHVEQFVLSRVCQIGHRLHRTFARYIEVESDDDEFDGYYERNYWTWLDSARSQLARISPIPIYDESWVAPDSCKPPKIEWGWSAPDTNPENAGPNAVFGPDGQIAGYAYVENPETPTTPITKQKHSTDYNYYSQFNEVERES